MIVAANRRPDRANETSGIKKVDNPVARLRPDELNRVAAIRYGRTIPANDEGARFRDRVLDALAMSGNEGRPRAAGFLASRCPWMTPVERANAIETAFKSPRYWSPLALGNDLNITADEHQKARVRTFRVAGMTDADMKAKRKADDAAQKREKRLRERLEAKPTASRPARRVDAILTLLPKDDWWNVTAIVNQLKRSKGAAFGTLGRETDSLRPAVHRAIKHGIKAGRLQSRIVTGSKMTEAMEIKRGPRA
jgi:hypothetical protein